MQIHKWQLRTLAIFCLISGVSRAAFGFVPWQDSRVDFEIAALFIDLFGLFGLVGFYYCSGPRLKFFGFLGFSIAVAGLALITGPDAEFHSIDIYETGGIVIGVGLAFLSVALIKNNIAMAAAWAWLSMIALHLLAILLNLPQASFVIVGVLYGAGFAFLGAHQLRSIADKYVDLETAL